MHQGDKKKKHYPIVQAKEKIIRGMDPGEEKM